MHPPRDTIAAIASPSGAASLAILRLSGPDAFVIGERLFASPSSPRDRSWRIVRGTLAVTLRTGAGAVEACLPSLAWCFESPRSYTGEDLLEFHLPGAPPLANAALRAATEEGARVADPGEFTLRAFLHGRIDLGQAESVERLIAATGEAERRAALARLGGELSQRLGAWRAELLHLCALIETTLDFDENELDEDLESGLRPALTRVRDECRDLAPRVSPHRPVEDGLLVPLAGLTNAGKSTLLNALLGKDAALVSPAPSTTRDRLRHPLPLGRFTLLLQDGPGHDPAAAFAAELDAQARARHAAAVILLVVDSSRPADPALRDLLQRLPPARIVLVFGKRDLPQQLAPDTVRQWLAAAPHLTLAGEAELSAATGAGLDGLRALLRAEAVGALAAAPGGAVSAREAAEVRAAASHVDEALRLLDTEAGGELVAEELRAAHAALSRAQGEGYAEDVLESIFSRFCIGK